MNYSSRFFLYAPLALVVLIAAAVSLLWWRTAGAMEQQLAALKGQEVPPQFTAGEKKSGRSVLQSQRT